MNLKGTSSAALGAWSFSPLSIFILFNLSGHRYSCKKDAWFTITEPCVFTLFFDIKEL